MWGTGRGGGRGAEGGREGAERESLEDNFFRGHIGVTLPRRSRHPDIPVWAFPSLTLLTGSNTIYF